MAIRAEATRGRGGDPTFADDLRTFVGAFTSRWRLIALVMAIALGLGVAYLWTAKPGYTSSVDIFIDPRERKMVDLDVAPTGMGSSSQGADTALVESQVAILRSRSVLSTLIRREGLESDGEFGGAASEGLVAALRQGAKALVYGPNAGSYGQMSPLDLALDKLDKAVRIKRVGQTYVLNVSVTTGAPDRSAKLANALAGIYLAEGQQAGDDSALETARSLEARLEELRRTSEASQRAVEDYRKEQGLIGAQGALVDERQLAELTAQVVSASIATKSARAALEEVRRGGADPSSSILSSDIATQLRLQLDQALSEEKIAAATYGDRHPRLVRARENRQSLQRALQAELSRVSERAASDFQKASETEASLKALLDQYEARLAGSNAASVRLRELEEAAARDRALHDSFATRARQAREQISLPTTTARIISVAEPASRPSEPRVAIVLAVALFLGGVAGFGLAWLMHLLAGPQSVPHPVRLAVVSSERHPSAAE